MALDAPLDAAFGGFHFTAAMHAVCVDIVARCAEFRHVDMDRVLVTFAQARRRSHWGFQAKLTPLRFAGGSRTCVRQGEVYTLQSVYVGGQEMLYLLTFYLPRFLDQTFAEKMVTIFHELQHISPHFDGDVRRFSGRCQFHTQSQAQFDAEMSRLSRRYLELGPPDSVLDFLRHNFDTLRAKAGEIGGCRTAMPKLVKLPRRGAA